MRAGLTIVVFVASLAGSACGGDSRAAGASATPKGDEHAPRLDVRDSGSMSNTAADPMSDRAITARVQARFLADEMVRGESINVETKDRVVTLKGTVNSKEAFEQAVRAAEAVDGVKSVINELKWNATLKHDGEHHQDDASGARK